MLNFEFLLANSILLTILEEIGVKKVINAWGTVTVLGGTTMSNEVIEAMREASKVYVDMKNLHNNAGNIIAKMLNVEAVCISSGATAGLVLATAACITRGDTEKILALPKSNYSKNKVVVQTLHRNAFVNILRIGGAELIQVGSETGTKPKDLEDVLDDTVAVVMYFVFDPQPGVLPLQEVIRLAHKKSIPVIVDAAAELPPVANLTEFTRMGADLVVFSGGKAIGGPNNTGLIIGRRDLIETCLRLEYYEYVGSDTIALLGRAMKVSKEDILAIVTALRQYLERDHDKEMKSWEEKVDSMISGLSKSRLSKARKEYPGSGHGPRPLVIPRAAIDFNENKIGVNAQEISEILRAGDPSIYVYVKDNVLFLNQQCLQDQEEKIIVSRLIEISG